MHLKKIKSLVLSTVLMATVSTANAALLSAAPYKIDVTAIIDTGIGVLSNLGTNNKSAAVFISGPMKTSRFTIRGEQYIGDGLIGEGDVLTAGFHLEQQILPGDGTQGVSSSNGASNSVFGLASNIWIKDEKLGKLTLGRQDSITYQAQNKLDTRGGINFGSSLPFWTDSSAFGGTSTKVSGVNSLNGANQWSNAVRYDLPTWNGISLSGQYAVGGVSGNDEASTKKAWSVIYTGVKDLTLALSQDYINNSSGVEVGRTTLIGGNYQLNKLKLATGYVVFENPSKDGQANSKFNMKEISAKYDVTDKFSVSGGVYRFEDEVNSANHALELSLVGDYTLNKHMTAYAGWSQIDNSGNFGFVPVGNSFNLNSLSTTYPSVANQAGQTQSAVVAGLKLTF